MSQTVIMANTRESATGGTFKVEAEYVSESGLLAVTGDPKMGWAVYHLPSGLKVPHRITGTPGAQFPGKTVAWDISRFQNKTAARAYMQAVEATEILNEERQQSRERVQKLRAWLQENYPRPVED